MKILPYSLINTKGLFKGKATVTRGDEIFEPGVKHRLENQTDADPEIIEVQVGEYLGEDDIVRFDVKF